MRKFRKGNIILEIDYEEEPANPREDSNLGIITAEHSRYNLGDEKLPKDSDGNEYETWEEVATHLFDECKAVVIMPLYMYEHSGITIKTSPFGCKWDSGQIGFVYCTKEKMEEYGITDEKEAKRIIMNEIKIYDTYLRGEFLYFVKKELIKCKCCNHTSEKILDSCGGFDNVDDILSETGFNTNEELN